MSDGQFYEHDLCKQFGVRMIEPGGTVKMITSAIAGDDNTIYTVPTGKTAYVVSAIFGVSILSTFTGGVYCEITRISDSATFRLCPNVATSEGIPIVFSPFLLYPIKLYEGDNILVHSDDGAIVFNYSILIYECDKGAI